MGGQIDYGRLAACRPPRHPPYRFFKAGVRKWCKAGLHGACKQITWWRIPIAWVRFKCLCECHSGPIGLQEYWQERMVKVRRFIKHKKSRQKMKGKTKQ